MKYGTDFMEAYKMEGLFDCLIIEGQNTIMYGLYRGGSKCMSIFMVSLYSIYWLLYLIALTKYQQILSFSNAFTVVISLTFL